MSFLSSTTCTRALLSSSLHLPTREPCFALSGLPTAPIPPSCLIRILAASKMASSTLLITRSRQSDARAHARTLSLIHTHKRTDTHTAHNDSREHLVGVRASCRRK